MTERAPPDGAGNAATRGLTGSRFRLCPHDSTTTGTGPWRLLILDPDPADPKLIMATVATPGDVRAARIGAPPRPIGEATMWVRAQLGRPAVLVPMPGALAWRIDEGGKPR